ncbi:MAG: hypothetical protein K6T75_00135 [Acetobacteraceae bacterium]|nr:hypothetical protein [Acetobacteraceae bacterium]
MDQVLEGVLAELEAMPHLAYGRDDPDRELELASMDLIQLVVSLERRFGVLIEEDELRRRRPRSARAWADLVRASRPAEEG